MNEYVVLFGINNSRMIVTASSRSHAKLVAQGILGPINLVVLDMDEQATAPAGALLQLVGAR